MRKSKSLTSHQLAAIAAPARLAIVGELSRGDASVRELAERIGRPVSGLYHHINRLLEAGVLEPAGERPSLRRPEKVYVLKSSLLSSIQASKSEAGRQALAQTCRAILALVARELQADLTGPRPITKGRRRTTALRRLELELSSKQLEVLNTEIDALVSRYAHLAQETRGGSCVALTIALTRRRRSAD